MAARKSKKLKGAKKLSGAASPKHIGGIKY